jgi:hypothetical protein
MAHDPDDARTDMPGVFFLDEAGQANTVEEQSYQAAERKAREDLAGLDSEYQAERCGARVLGSSAEESIVEVPFFQKPMLVTFPSGEVRDTDGRELPVWERILLLHYLAGDSSPPLRTELISFKQVPSGGFYFDAFRRRSHDPLARAFGDRPALLHHAGELLGAEPEVIGDAAVRVPVLPRVPVVAVVHAADEEFPSEARLLFESSITAYFCTEDIAVLGGLVAGRLIQASRDLR